MGEGERKHMTDNLSNLQLAVCQAVWITWGVLTSFLFGFWTALELVPVGVVVCYSLMTLIDSVNR